MMQGNIDAQSLQHGNDEAPALRREDPRFTEDWRQNDSTFCEIKFCLEAYDILARFLRRTVISHEELAWAHKNWLLCKMVHSETLRRLQYTDDLAVRDRKGAKDTVRYLFQDLCLDP